MFILKNAFRFISRTKGRNVLIFILTVIIFILACTSFAIITSAWNMSKKAYKTTELTAVIMSSTQGGRGYGSTGEANLTFDQIKTYGSSSHLKTYYYYLTSNVRANIRAFESNNVFRAVGYSSYESMTDFVNGTSEIFVGSMFEFNENYNCIISAEVAYENKLDVGDTITISNPANRNEAYDFKICGIYINNGTESQSNQAVPYSPNNILMSYETLDKIIKKSYVDNVVVGQRGEENAFSGRLTARFILKDAASSDGFIQDLKKMGLSGTQTVQTSVTSMQQSLKPMNNLSKTVGNILLIVFGAGSLIVAFMNFMNIRSRKQELGILSCIGMRKKKILQQFISEVLIITVVAMLAGAVVSTVIADTAANALLKNEIKAEQNALARAARNNRRNPGNQGNQGNRTLPGGTINNVNNITNVNFVDEINTGINLRYIVGILLMMIIFTLISGSIAAVFIYRFSPFKAMQDYI